MRHGAIPQTLIIGLVLGVLLLSACKPAPSTTPSWQSSTPIAASNGMCSPNDGYDALADSDIIVAGWIEGWQGSNSEPTNQLETIHPRIDVKNVFKGQGIPDALTITDDGSLIYGPTLQWGGTGNSCGDLITTRPVTMLSWV